MYYHVLIETKAVAKEKSKRLELLDLQDKEKIMDEILIPYVKDEEFIFKGFFLQKKNILRLLITTTDLLAQDLANIEMKRWQAEGLFSVIYPTEVIEDRNLSNDVTTLLLKEANSMLEMTNTKKVIKSKKIDTHKVFIVHGRDEKTKLEVARFIEKLGFQPIILSEQASNGKTIIEKIEDCSDVGFGIVLYTPCDVGYLKGMESEKKTRARQNVVFEHGYLVAKLGREKVCALVKDDTELPNDISGVVYIPICDEEGWKIKLAKEMKNAGYSIDLNLLYE